MQRAGRGSLLTIIHKVNQLRVLSSDSAPSVSIYGCSEVKTGWWACYQGSHRGLKRAGRGPGWREIERSGAL